MPAAAHLRYQGDKASARPAAPILGPKLEIMAKSTRMAWRTGTCRHKARVLPKRRYNRHIVGSRLALITRELHNIQPGVLPHFRVPDLDLNVAPP